MFRMSDSTLSYLTPEARARVQIDRMLDRAGWIVQSADQANLNAGRGVAVREFVMEPPHGRVDYLLFVDRVAVGVIEAKKEGETLTGVEWQSAKYRDGLPRLGGRDATGVPAVHYESTGVETRFTSTLDPEPRSREVFWFHRPETLTQWISEEIDDNLARYAAPPAADTCPTCTTATSGPAQATAIRNLEESLAENRPRALIQMATGSGQDLHGGERRLPADQVRRGARRVLFLVDRANLGRQTLQGVPGVHDARRRAQVHRALQRPAPLRRT